jgi:tRNA(Ile)-lysidine synthase
LELLAEVHADAIVTAHHSNDLLETRLIRLVRGIGPQGIRAISELSGKWFRPWLKVSKEQIVDYANTESVEFLSDPSNGEDRYLRNFMRNTWLPLLEKKRPGSTKSLSRSLEILSEMSAAKDVSEGDSQYNILVSESGIDRMAFTALSREDQRKVLARFFKLNNLLNYTEGHISEVIKRLDSDKKQFQFRTARCNWVVNASHICLGSAE